MATIYITQSDNDNYFNQKMATWNWGFCKVQRVVRNITTDEFGTSTGTISRRGKADLIVDTTDIVEGAMWEVVGVK